MSSAEYFWFAALTTVSRQKPVFRLLCGNFISVSVLAKSVWKTDFCYLLILGNYSLMIGICLFSRVLFGCGPFKEAFSWWTGLSGLDLKLVICSSRHWGFRSILQPGNWSWPAFCLGEDFERLWLAAVLLRSAGAWRRCLRSAVSFPEPTLGCYSAVNLLYKEEPGGPLRARYPSS